MYNYNGWVYSAICKRFGKENISQKRTAKEYGTLGATEFILKDGTKFVAYFHYQKEEVCILGESN